MTLNFDEFSGSLLMKIYQMAKNMFYSLRLLYKKPALTILKRYQFFKCQYELYHFIAIKVRLAVRRAKTSGRKRGGGGKID